MHVVQYQRNDFGVGAQYDFDVVIFDGAKKQIELVPKQPVNAKTNSLVVTSALPATVLVTSGADNSAPVGFAYNGQSWDSTSQSHQSNLGTGPNNGYENGNHTGNMGFTC